MGYRADPAPERESDQRLGLAAELPHLQVLGGRHGVFGLLLSCGGQGRAQALKAIQIEWGSLLQHAADGRQSWS